MFRWTSMLEVREEKFMSSLTSFEGSLLLNKLLIVTVFEVPELPQKSIGLPTFMFQLSMYAFLIVLTVGTRIALYAIPGGVTKVETWVSQGSNISKCQMYFDIIQVGKQSGFWCRKWLRCSRISCWNDASRQRFENIIKNNFILCDELYSIASIQAKYGYRLNCIRIGPKNSIVLLVQASEGVWGSHISQKFLVWPHVLAECSALDRGLHCHLSHILFVENW